MAIKVAHDLDPKLAANLAFMTGVLNKQSEDNDLDSRQQHDLAKMNLAHDLSLEKSESALDDRQEMAEFESKLDYKKLTQNQKFEVDQIEKSIYEIQSSNKYNDEEKISLIDQLEAKKHGIKPLDREEEFPQGKAPGDVWEDDDTGASYTRDNQGNVKMLTKPVREKQIPLKDLVKMRTDISESLKKPMKNKDGELTGEFEYPDDETINNSIKSMLLLQKEINQVEDDELTQKKIDKGEIDPPPDEIDIELEQVPLELLDDEDKIMYGKIKEIKEKNPELALRLAKAIKHKTSNI